MSGMKSGSKDRQYQYENPLKSNLFLFDVGLCHTIIQHEKPQLGPVLIASGKTVYKLNLKSGLVQIQMFGWQTQQKLSDS